MYKIKEITSFLLPRQQASRITSIRSVQSEFYETVEEIMGRVKDVKLIGEATIGYTPPLSSSSLLYIVPSLWISESLGFNRNRILYPNLTNEIVTSTLAARIYLYNRNMSYMAEETFANGRKQHSLESSYAQLALATFGNPIYWDCGLCSYNGQQAKVVPAISVFYTLYCRVCGRKLNSINEMNQGMDKHCREIAEEYAKFYGYSRKTGEQLIEALEYAKSYYKKYTFLQAISLYPNGYITLETYLNTGIKQGIGKEALWRAIGGREGYIPAIDKEWEIFVIAGKKYLDKQVLELYYKLGTK